MAATYNWPNIRALLIAGFTEDELRQFCFDTPEFKPLYPQLARSSSAADIADLYVFPSPQRPGHLVLVMTVFPAAMPGTFFSDGIIYRFRLRPVTPTAGGAGLRFEFSQTEYAFSCTFAAPAKSGYRRTMLKQGWQHSTDVQQMMPYLY
ncbi:MAG: DUF4331 domain-containing protein [Nitrosomonas sp.]|nr:DUF4331 domain-containing protein [Nitrosomonas sp.]